MVIEACERAEQAMRELVQHSDNGTGTVEEFRHALKRVRAVVALAARFQSTAAALIAEREGHGDKGEQLLADAAGLSRRDAKSQAKTNRILDKMPAARAAVDAGEVPLANARALADAAERVGIGEVASDPELLEKAATQRPENFNKNLRSWAVDREGDDGASEHRRQRKNRGVNIYTGDDGMTHIHALLDAVTGKRVENHIQREAKHRWADAKKNPGSDCKSFRHALADAFAALITNPADSTGTAGGFADIAVVATVSQDGERLIGEIAGGDRLPASVLEELMCNARIAGVLFNRAGTAIWQGHSARVATETQKRHLIAKYGGCFHCGAHPSACQAHHIVPFSHGGKTDIDNLVLVCWTCHQHIHHHNWQIHRTSSGGYTLHPPGHAPREPIPAAATAEIPEPARARATAGGIEPAQLQLE